MKKRNLLDYFAIALIILDKKHSKILIWAKLRQLKSKFDIDKSVRIKESTRIYGNGKIKIGKGTYFGTNTFIVSNPKEANLTIGEHCRISHNVHIRTVGYDVNNLKTNPPGVKHADIKIGDYCWIGKGVLITLGVSLGNGVTVGGNSVVTKSFPDNVVLGGVPARIIKRINDEN
jgi:maltose O-acetyltransferase